MFVTLCSTAILFSLANLALANTFPVQYRQRGYFYKPPSDVTISTLVNYYHNFTLTSGDETYRDDLRDHGVTSPMLQYVRFDAIQDPGSCTAQPDHNQVAWEKGDFCDISTNHPGWFLLDTNGNRMYNGDMVMMDPGSSGWRWFFRTRIRTTQQLGWDGVFLDNVEGSLTKRSQYGQMPQKYPTDDSYGAAIEGMLDFLYNGYFKSYGRPMFANIIALRPTTRWFSYMEFLDGAMCEAWATGWGNTDWRSKTAWLENLARAEQTQNDGKFIIGVGQGNKTNTARQRYAYASFLLVDDGRMFFRYGIASSYTEAWTYPNYLYDLGFPLGLRYQSGDNYCRNYSKGQACVNPTTHTSSITVNP